MTEIYYRGKLRAAQEVAQLEIYHWLECCVETWGECLEDEEIKSITDEQFEEVSSKMAAKVKRLSDQTR